MNNTPGLEEELKTRLSEIVNKDLSKRQVGKIVELFAPDKGNTITDEEIEKLAKDKFPYIEYINPDNDFGYDRSYDDIRWGIEKRRNDWIEGYKANTLHRVVEVKSAEEILDQYWHYEAGKPLEHFRVLQAMEEYASQFKHSLPVSDEDELWQEFANGFYKYRESDGDIHFLEFVKKQFNISRKPNSK